MTFNVEQVIEFFSEAFVEGCKYTVEMYKYMSDNINEKYQAKHKKILKTLQEEMMAGIATVGKDKIKKIAGEYLKGKLGVEDSPKKEEEKARTKRRIGEER